MGDCAHIHAAKFDFGELRRAQEARSQSGFPSHDQAIGRRARQLAFPFWRDESVFRVRDGPGIGTGLSPNIKSLGRASMIMIRLATPVGILFGPGSFEQGLLQASFPKGEVALPPPHPIITSHPSAVRSNAWRKQKEKKRKKEEKKEIGPHLRVAETMPWARSPRRVRTSRIGHEIGKSLKWVEARARPSTPTPQIPQLPSAVETPGGAIPDMIESRPGLTRAKPSTCCRCHGRILHM